MTIKVVLAGATGWAGSELARAIAGADDMVMTGAIARRTAGRRLGEVLSEPRLDCMVHDRVEPALAAGCDVFVEYSKPDGAKHHIRAALEAGANVVVATSGLTDEDYAEFDRIARARERGLLAAGNFALTAVLLQKFAEIAAKYIPHVEVIDYAKDSKVDAPSGTVRELAYRLGKVRQPALTVPFDRMKGPREVRGATMNGVQVHALRLPGYVIGVEAVFGMEDQRLHLRHEAGAGAKPYIDGAMLAIRQVHTLLGVHRGLDCVMQW